MHGHLQAHTKALRNVEGKVPLAPRRMSVAINSLARTLVGGFSLVKVLVSPLFLVLLGLIGGQIRLYLNWQQFDRRQRSALVFLSLVTIALWSLSTPVVETQLAHGLEWPYYAGRDPSSMHVDVVVVLSAGYSHGPVPEMDVVSGTTYARVVRGVQVFKKSKARVLIMSGRSLGGDPRRLTDLMKALAVAMGLPSERVRIEPRSTNTFMHPIELAQLREVRASDILAVVTSAWHLPRAMAEFQRHFSKVVAIPADFDTPFSPSSLSWLPVVSSLQGSTKLLDERLGMAWYALRDWVPKRLGRIIGSKLNALSRVFMIIRVPPSVRRSLDRGKNSPPMIGS